MVITQSYRYKLNYYPLPVSVDGCVGSNILIDNKSDRLLISNKTEGESLETFHMLAGINESNYQPN